MSDLGVRLVTPADLERWDAYVRSHSSTTHCDYWAWRELVERTYRLPHFWALAEEEGIIRGLLALTHTRHPILGNYLATAPFGNYGGFYADTDAARDALLRYAADMRERLSADYVLVRHCGSQLSPPADWIQDHAYSTYILKLDPDPRQLWETHLRAKQRNQIQKSAQQDFRIEFGRKETLSYFWRVMCHSMRELGSPYHSKEYLLNMLKLFEEQVEFAIVFTPESKPIAASLLIYNRDTAYHLHANVLRAYRPQCAGDFLYWSVIQHCCRKGIRYFEMGRSLADSGGQRFKMKWRPRPQPLAYWYNLRPGKELPDLNQANPRFKLAIWVWKQLPLGVTQAVGPRLIWGML